MTENPYLEGKILVVDKPLNWTSFDVVNKIRYAIKDKYNIKKIKVGHAGTLDPLATGVVVICTGKKTKIINDFLIEDKSYVGKFQIGATTPSFDLETEIDYNYPIPNIDESILKYVKKLNEMSFDDRFEIGINAKSYALQFNGVLEKYLKILILLTFLIIL